METICVLGEDFEEHLLVQEQFDEVMSESWFRSDSVVKVIEPDLSVGVVDFRMLNEVFYVKQTFRSWKSFPENSLDSIVYPSFWSSEVWYSSTDTDASAGHNAYISINATF